jgi:transcription antitermination factor NusG
MRGFEVFAPVITERRLYADRFKNIDVPVLSGYVLIRWDGKGKNDILSAPAVQYLVSFGGKPTELEDTEIANIRKMIENGGQPVPFLSTGHRVRVETGVLAGVEGIYLRRSRGQLVVSIDLIERSVALHVDENRVRPLEGAAYVQSSLAGV